MAGLKNIAVSEVLERIRFENPWWSENETDVHFRKMPRRAYFNQFLSLCGDLSVQRAVVLMGPRRVGKTVMLYHLVQALLENGINQRRILFITVENPIYNNLGLEKLFRYGREAAGRGQQLRGWYVIFDEIQYLRDWDLHLKSLVESYREVRFIVSGSAASALKLKSHESGAGRFTDFMLPLTFYEFIRMQGLEDHLQAVEHAYGGENVQGFKAADIRQFNRSLRPLRITLPMNFR